MAMILGPKLQKVDRNFVLLLLESWPKKRRVQKSPRTDSIHGDGFPKVDQKNFQNRRGGPLLKNNLSHLSQLSAPELWPWSSALFRVFPTSLNVVEFTFLLTMFWHQTLMRFRLHWMLLLSLFLPTMFWQQTSHDFTEPKNDDTYGVDRLRDQLPTWCVQNPSNIHPFTSFPLVWTPLAPFRV